MQDIEIDIEKCLLELMKGFVKTSGYVDPLYLSTFY